MEQLGMEESRAAVTLRDELQEMYSHPTFKKIFLDGYFTDEPARIAQALTNPSMQDEVDQRCLGEMIRGIGHTQNYLLEVVRLGNTAQLQIEEADEEAKQELIKEAQEIEIDPITGEEIVVGGA